MNGISLGQRLYPFREVRVTTAPSGTEISKGWSARIIQFITPPERYYHRRRLAYSGSNWIFQRPTDKKVLSDKQPHLKIIQGLHSGSWSKDWTCTHVENLVVRFEGLTLPVTYVEIGGDPGKLCSMCVRLFCCCCFYMLSLWWFYLNNKCTGLEGAVG